MKRRLSSSELALLDRVEALVRGIRHRVDVAGYFQAEVRYALQQGGLGVVTEPNVGEGRRCDLAVVGDGHVVALELDHVDIPQRTVDKLRDLPDSVLRVVVLRQCEGPVPTCQHADRVFGVTSDMASVPWLVEGRQLLIEPRRGPLAIRSALSQASTLSEARRRLLNGRPASARGKR